MNPQIAYLLNLSIQQIQSERLNDAERTLSQLLKLQPKNSDAYNFLSVIAAYRLKWEEALDLVNKSLKISQNNSVALSNKGNILKELGRYSEALASYKRSIQLDPRHAEAFNNLGNIYQDNGQYHEAIQAYDNAIKLDANYAEAYSNKGNNLQKIGQYDSALSLYDAALRINPKYIQALLNRGFAFLRLKKFDDALRSCDEAILINPLSPLAWTDKGVICQHEKYYEKAIEFFNKAISIDEKFAEAYGNKGSCLIELKDYDSALQCYSAAFSVKPSLDYLLGDIIGLKLLLADWRGLDKSIDMVKQGVEKDQRVTNPFKLLAAIDDPNLALRAAKNWVKAMSPQKDILDKINRKAHPKIRLGYFSADFRNHPVSFLAAELFELHDRDRFEVYAFSVRSAEPGDAMRERLVNAFDHFIDVEHKTDIEVAQLARELEIDIAIDLGGHTQFAPTGIMSYRAAPIQINYLGYPGTMGAPYMDYIIADPILIPPENQQFYSEKVIYLPNCYQPNDRKKVISPRKFTRAEVGLPEKGFVFCSFNNNFKILPQIFASWINILKKVEGSVLWLLEDNSLAAENLRKEAQKAGVNPDRLIFAQRVPHAEHLARHELADLFLDTYPYNAHTTASDALWAGLPLITIQGSSFASRVASSLLTAVGLEELITQSNEQYETLAVSLSSDRHRIYLLKTKLAGCKTSSLLYDSKTLTTNIEDCYLRIFAR